MVGPENRAQVVHFATAHSIIRLGSDFYAQSVEAAAFIISHEYGHVIQRNTLNLVFGDPSEAMTLDQWFTLTANPGDDGPGEAYFNSQQDDANRYACSVTTVASEYTATYCD